MFNFYYLFMLIFFFFFFSSRRRHTRLQGDWSSDVCSSDLNLLLSSVHLLLLRPALATVRPVLSRDRRSPSQVLRREEPLPTAILGVSVTGPDRKSTRLNSSHLVISYAVFCLKKKNNLLDSE